jgi:hypothetical protein
MTGWQMADQDFKYQEAKAAAQEEARVEAARWEKMYKLRQREIDIRERGAGGAGKAPKHTEWKSDVEKAMPPSKFLDSMDKDGDKRVSNEEYQAGIGRLADAGPYSESYHDELQAAAILQGVDPSVVESTASAMHLPTTEGDEYKAASQQAFSLEDAQGPADPTTQRHLEQLYKGLALVDKGGDGKGMQFEVVDGEVVPTEAYTDERKQSRDKAAIIAQIRKLGGVQKDIVNRYGAARQANAERAASVARANKKPVIEFSDTGNPLTIGKEAGVGAMRVTAGALKDPLIRTGEELARTYLEVDSAVREAGGVAVDAFKNSWEDVQMRLKEFNGGRSMWQK